MIKQAASVCPCTEHTIVDYMEFKVKVGFSVSKMESSSSYIHCEENWVSAVKVIFAAKLYLVKITSQSGYCGFRVHWTGDISYTIISVNMMHMYTASYGPSPNPHSIHSEP